MYRAPPSIDGLLNASYLIGAGATPLLALLGGFFGILSYRSRNPAGWMLGIVSIVMLAQFGFFATGKPGEYARFALFADIALALAAVVGIGSRLRHRAPRAIALIALAGFTGLWGASYLWHFMRDSIPRSTRMIVAERLQSFEKQGVQVMQIRAEPAPYSLPPVDLFTWKLVLAREDSHRGFVGLADVSIRTVDVVPSHPQASAQYWIHPRLEPTPISWAAKPFEVIRKEK